MRELDAPDEKPLPLSMVIEMGKTRSPTMGSLLNAPGLVTSHKKRQVDRVWPLGLRLYEREARSK
ncbi:hypothetical protein KGM_202197 [Danaus plexippus plexippus]|uniref:Uncharacterized protein n=1 Tax=Danaus plexippus plexippus TaxID=278856 RepID=A0A212FIT0_DANPL|nr:hypothetical protein KGM_202197 [Danaus plexippus plexippus]